MKQYLPNVMPHIIVEFAPIVEPVSTNVLMNFLFFEYSDRGFISFVKVTLGPQNTKSLILTPEYIETLFWIFTLLPILTSSPI